MVEQFRDRIPVFGIFVQTVHDKIFDLIGSRLASRKVNLFLNHFHGLRFVPDLKRHLSQQQLIGKNTNVPNIDLVIVILFLNYLRGRVERSAAESVSEERRIDSPAEIANFDDILNRVNCTSWKRMFSGLRSLWIISLSCMYSTA